MSNAPAQNRTPNPNYPDLTPAELLPAAQLDPGEYKWQTSESIKPNAILAGALVVAAVTAGALAQTKEPLPAPSIDKVADTFDLGRLGASNTSRFDTQTSSKLNSASVLKLKDGKLSLGDTTGPISLANGSAAPAPARVRGAENTPMWPGDKPVTIEVGPEPPTGDERDKLNMAAPQSPEGLANGDETDNSDGSESDAAETEQDNESQSLSQERTDAQETFAEDVLNPNLPRPAIGGIVVPPKGGPTSATYNVPCRYDSRTQTLHLAQHDKNSDDGLRIISIQGNAAIQNTQVFLRPGNITPPALFTTLGELFDDGDSFLSKNANADESLNLGEPVAIDSLNKLLIAATLRIVNEELEVQAAPAVQPEMPSQAPVVQPEVSTEMPNEPTTPEQVTPPIVRDGDQPPLPPQAPPFPANAKG